MPRSSFYIPITNSAHYSRQLGRGSRLDDMGVFRGLPYQRGFGIGEMPVFSGLPYQRGSSFGSFFGGLFRRILPILGSAARTFISSAAEGLNRGDTLGSAAKGALMPTLAEGVHGAVREFRKRPRQPETVNESTQTGGRYKRRRRRKVLHSISKFHRKRRHKKRSSKHKKLGSMSRTKKHGRRNRRRRPHTKRQQGGKKKKGASYFAMLKQKYGHKKKGKKRGQHYKSSTPTSDFNF